MIRVIIVDDHAVVRKGLRQIFEETPDIDAVEEAGSGDELFKKIRYSDYDVVILDISMPGRDGLDIIKELRYMRPELKVLIFTMYPEEQYAVRVIKAGASGYLNKESEPEELITAIRRVAQGRKYISSHLAELLATTLEGGGEKQPHETLSDREFQVMCMIASGKTVSEIANVINLSINTVSTYRLRVLEKMNMKSNAELTHYAIKMQLVD